MSDDNNSVDLDGDLDTFSAELFGQSKAPEPASSDESEAPEETPDAPKEDHPTEDDAPVNPEDGDEGKGDEAKPKKNRFQERIDELTSKQREAERKAEDLAARLTEALAKLEKNDSPTPTQEQAEVGPSPDDKNEDGTDKYPLGEFDPNYIRALTKHTLEAERNALKAQEAEEARRREAESKQSELQTEWNGKLDTARERYPDFQEKGQALVETFEGLDPAYGEYLGNVIMGMEYGPDVLYHLANNIDEAHKIFSSSAAQATIALGRLEARFIDLAEDKKNRLKVSNAPTPPAHMNKGSAIAQAEPPGDTDDLDAFESAFFKKKKK